MQGTATLNCGIDTWKRFMSRDMAFSIVTRLWVRQQSNHGSFVGRVKKNSLR